MVFVVFSISLRTSFSFIMSFVRNEFASVTHVTINFREPTKTLVITFGSGLNFFHNFDVHGLKEVPLIDLHGNVHIYTVQSLFINKPFNNHWTCLLVDWANDSGIQLQSLGILSGEVKRLDSLWLQRNMSHIG
eukprot:209232_1